MTKVQTTRDGSSEAGSSKAGTSEAGTSEAGTSEAGTSEAGTSEAGTSEAGTSEVGASKARRKILFVSHELEFGGAERSLLDLMHALDRDQFDLHLATSGEGPLAAAARDTAVTVHAVPMRFPNKLSKALGLMRARRSLKRLIKAERFDLVHMNTIIAGYVGLTAARACRIPSVWHLRDMTYPLPARIACRRADRVIANSKATAATLDGGKIEVVYNGVDARFFEARDTRAEVRTELGLPASAQIVAMVGRLDAWKGHREFLDAATLIATRCSCARFVIVGSEVFGTGAEYRGELEEKVRGYDLGDRVHFLGKRDDLPRLMGAFDCLVNPSQQPEPFGRSVAEAQASGVPVIGTDAGGIPEIIEDGVTGYLIPIGDSKQLADRVVDLLADESRRLEMSSASHKNAQRFASMQHASAVVAVWESIWRERPDA